MQHPPLHHLYHPRLYHPRLSHFLSANAKPGINGIGAWRRNVHKNLWFGFLVTLFKKEGYGISEELTNTKNILYITDNKSIVRKYQEGVERGGPG